MSHDPGPAAPTTAAQPAAAPPAAPAAPPTGVELDELCIRNLLDTSQEVIYFKDRQSRFLRVSLGTAQLHARSQEEMVGLTDADLFDGSHAGKAAADELRVMQTGEPILNHVERERWRDRPDSWVASSKFPLRDSDGAVIGTFGISRDVTRRVQVEQDLVRMAAETERASAETRRVEALLRSVLEGSSDAICLYDGDLRLRYVNPAAEALLGRPAAELVGRTDAEVGTPVDPESWEPALRRVLHTGEAGDVEFPAARADGEERWFHTSLSPERDAQGAVTGVLASVRDITPLKRAEQVLAHQAMHDSVTGLANRYLLMDRLGQALVRMERSPGRAALFFVDLDHFKDVNDVYGHEVGDQVLVELSRRLVSAARREDTVARLGGDEFVVLCERVGSDDHVREIADRIVDALAEPYDHHGTPVRLSASVGATATDDAGADPAALLRSADQAMYRAKQGGRNQYHLFDPVEAAEDHATLALEAELADALPTGRLRLVYQPLLSLADRRVLGFEALLRWDHPERGTLTPRDFLACAERSGLIVPIGAWVLDTACAQLAAWSREVPGAEGLTVSVNVAGLQLRDVRFPAAVVATVERHGLTPDRLRLEITERTLVAGGAAVERALEALAARGVQLAVDDFGATVTSLARLPQIPVSVVKLDRFADVTREPALVAAVIAMAHGLGMSVVGGGIETATQLAQLSDLACDDGQGFLLGPPLDLPAVDRLLQGGDPGTLPDGASVALDR